MAKNRAPTFSMETVDGRILRVAVWRASKATKKLPILFFNGIGANIEAMMPMAELLDDRDFITFDMPGIGGSPDPVVPYNALLMSRIAALLLDRFEMPLVDVMGVSWGGAMAQQFALQNGGRTHKLILVATSAGMLMVPGNPAALVKMADPRRRIRGFLTAVAITFAPLATQAQLDHKVRALQQAAQAGVARQQALVHLQPAKERRHVHARVARPGLHALRQLSRRQHLARNAQRQRLAKLARARKEDAAARVHAAQ
jgi:pimeloyl-ACP methyl ester carboxylesterase